jgi:hypothetical protein
MGNNNELAGMDNEFAFTPVFPYFYAQLALQYKEKVRDLG